MGIKKSIYILMLNCIIMGWFLRVILVCIKTQTFNTYFFISTAMFIFNAICAYLIVRQITKNSK